MCIRNTKIFAAAAAAALLLGAVSAEGSEATLLGDRAGFLFGHAHRCGVQDADLERLGPVIRGAISTFAVDDEDKRAAASAFGERFLASALGQELQDPLPSCAIVLSQFARLEQHRISALAKPDEGNRSMTDNQSKLIKRSSGNSVTGKRAKAGKEKSVRAEALTPERRAELELKRAAREVRGRPPSI
jgi:hypothetical protein